MFLRIRLRSVGASGALGFKLRSLRSLRLGRFRVRESRKSKDLKGLGFRTSQGLPV